MTGEPSTWRIELEVPSEIHVDIFEQAVSPDNEPVSTMEITPGAGWRLEVYCDVEPDRVEFAARLNVAAAICGIATPKFVIEKMAAIDWVKRVQENSPPVSAGRFFIYGSHVTDPVPRERIGIRIDAGAAFGAGTHETTQGCLMAFDRISRRGEIRSALDLGCGSGILAIGIAKLWGTQVLAVDDDPVAVKITAENSRINGVSECVQAVHGDGFAAAEMGNRAPFELIAANILADPLTSMASGVARHIARDGAVVLSGLLDRQSDQVISAYEDAGLRFANKIVLGEWHTLVMHRT